MSKQQILAATLVLSVLAIGGSAVVGPWDDPPAVFVALLLNPFAWGAAYVFYKWSKQTSTQHLTATWNRKPQKHGRSNCSADSPTHRSLLSAPRNKERLQRWLYTVELCLHTPGSDAMKLVLSLRPDVVCVLGDDAFTDNTTNQLTVQHNRSMSIFTLGMQVAEKKAS